MNVIDFSALGLVSTDLSHVQDKLNEIQQGIAKTTTYYTLTLKPVQNGPFSAQYDLKVGNLELPQQINLAAAALE